MPHTRSRAIAALLLASASGAALAQQAAPTDAQRIEELSRRLQALESRNGIAPSSSSSGDAATLADIDQRMRILERKLELQDEAAAAKAETTPVVTLSSDKGASIKSASGDVELKLRGLVQADGRFFIGDDAVPQNDTFLLRRVRPTLEGTWGKLIGFKLTPEFAGDSATLVDAYVDVKFDPRATLRIGKFTAPVGLERLQSSAASSMIELGFPTELVPNRDIGVQLQGEFAGSTVGYAVGAFNGAVDGRDAATTNPDNDFEFAGRVFFEPWKNDANALSGLGFGISGSHGDTHGSGNNFLPRYRTQSQAQFFNYRGTVEADGARTRWSPQAWYYRNAFGLIAEYAASKQDLLAADGTRTAIDNRAWQAVATYVLTGEEAGYRGVARPNHPFTPGAAGWGAFEIALRYGRLEIDDDAFPLFADPAVAASRATSWGLGLNWYLNGNFKLLANYTQTAFDDGAGGGADREDEKAFFTRAQFSF
jgi:phosphate-selective porin OprO/OprP